jgi:hypothetical protein
LLSYVIEPSILTIALAPNVALWPCSPKLIASAALAVDGRTVAPITTAVAPTNEIRAVFLNTLIAFL